LLWCLIIWQNIYEDNIYWGKIFYQSFATLFEVTFSFKLYKMILLSNLLWYLGAKLIFIPDVNEVEWQKIRVCIKFVL